MSDQICALLNGAGFDSVEALENNIAELVEKRMVAREKKNGKLADRLSEKLTKRERLQKDIAGKTFSSIGLYAPIILFVPQLILRFSSLPYCPNAALMGL